MSAAHGVHDHGLVEILIVMDSVDPPVGRLRILADARPAHRPQAGEVSFTGWLGLLRVLYQATGEPGTGPGPGS
jgi:hypothetical protein